MSILFLQTDYVNPSFLLDVSAVSKAFYGQGSGPIILRRLECTGRETSILECEFDANTSDCRHSDDAGVQCIGMLYYVIFTVYIMLNVGHCLH